MDAQSLMIGAGVCVVSGLLIYIISVFSMKEKTYEEVMEEQRRRQAEALAKPKTEKKVDKKAKKWKKGKGDKEKTDEKSQVTESESESSHKMVEYELEPEIIQPVEMAKSESKKASKEKTRKSKPILVNKDEKPLVKSQQDVDDAGHGFSPDHIPKDVLQMKRDHDVKAKAEKVTKQVEPEQRVKKSKDDVKLVKQEVLLSATVAPMMSMPPSEPKKNKKSKDSSGKFSLFIEYAN